jgi:iron(III) transport system permease protein
MAVALAAAFVPPVAHAAAWAAVAEGLRRMLGLAVTPLTGLPAAALAQSTAFLPLAIVVGFAGVAAIDPVLLDAGRIQRPDAVALRRVLVPLALPALLAGGGVAALLSLGDEAIPSAFGVSTSAMELFSAYAADGRAGATLALAWPLALVATLAALACAIPLSRVCARPSWRRPWSAPPAFGRWTRGALWSGAALAAAGSAAVFAALFVGAWPLSAAVRAVTDAGPDIAVSCGVAAACGVVACVVGLLAGSPLGPESRPSRWVWGVALLAAVVPAPVIGAGLVALYNNAWTAGAYDSPAMLVLAALARFAPVAAIAVSVTASHLDRGALEASIISARPARAYWRVVAPQLLVSGVAGGLLAAAFAAGELGATLMVLPPGTSTAVVRAFNLLHYGASEQVAAIALTVAAIGLAAASASWSVGRRMWAR